MRTDDFMFVGLALVAFMLALAGNLFMVSDANGSTIYVPMMLSGNVMSGAATNQPSPNPWPLYIISSNTPLLPEYGSVSCKVSVVTYYSDSSCQTSVSTITDGEVVFRGGEIGCKINYLDNYAPCGCTWCAVQKMDSVHTYITFEEDIPDQPDIPDEPDIPGPPEPPQDFFRWLNDVIYGWFCSIFGWCS